MRRRKSALPSSATVTQSLGPRDTPHHVCTGDCGAGSTAPGLIPGGFALQLDDCGLQHGHSESRLADTS